MATRTGSGLDGHKLFSLEQALDLFPWVGIVSTASPFFRIQDQFRRQQQSHQQQQQQSLSRQTQQAQLLRNFQSSSELNGPTVVHISPGFSFEMSGMGTSGVQLTGNGFQFDSGGVQMNVSGMEGTGLQFNTQVVDCFTQWGRFEQEAT